MSDPDVVPTKPGPAVEEVHGLAPERYVLAERLGAGGMGVVWAAHDRVLDRPVALKVLHDRFLGEREQARLAVEGRAMARLSHPRVVQVFDVGEHAGRTYLAMELVRGVDLGRWLATPRRWPAIVTLFRAVADGLAAAHAAGIIHRDVKPSNILVDDDDQPHIADFGVAHTAGAGAGPPSMQAGAGLLQGAATVTVGVIGTVPYLAPAQLGGDAADAHSDQFAFFVALYEALHGRRPFEAAGIEAQRHAIAAGCPPPIRAVPRWLHRVVARGLAADPDRRWPSMTAAGAALVEPARRRQVWVGAAAVTALAGGVLAWWSTRAPTLAEACSDLPARRAALRAEPDRRAAAQAFARLGPPYAAEVWTRMEREVGRRADAWVAAATQACAQATTIQPATLTCLWQQHEALRAQLARWQRPSLADAERADRLIPALPEAGDCGHDAATLAMIDRALTPAVAATAEGRTTLEQAVAAAEAAGVVRRHVRALTALAAVSEPATRPDLLRRAQAAAAAALPDDDLELVATLEALIEVALDGGGVAEANSAAKRLTDLTRALGERHPAHGRALRRAAQVNLAMGRVDKAAAKASTALAIAHASHPPDHPDVAAAQATVRAVAAVAEAPLAAELNALLPGG